ncbi:MAG: prepilin peptidase [Alphaproteobacteria bacterium]
MFGGGLIPLSLWIAYQDLKRGKIPNRALLLFSLLVGVQLYLEKNPYPFLYSGLMGLVLVGGTLCTPFAQKIGAGDLKLFILSCFCIDIFHFPFFMIMTGSIGVLWALVYRLMLKQPSFPFGPSLLMGLWATLLKTYFFLRF